MALTLGCVCRCGTHKETTPVGCLTALPQGTSDRDTDLTATPACCRPWRQCGGDLEYLPAVLVASTGAHTTQNIITIFVIQKELSSVVLRLLHGQITSYVWRYPRTSTVLKRSNAPSCGRLVNLAWHDIVPWDISLHGTVVDVTASLAAMYRYKRLPRPNEIDDLGS